jgi:hypothetical protein
MATDIATECAAVDDSLLVETGRIIPGLVLRKAVAMEPIIALVNKTKGTWTDGIGTTVQVATSERMLTATSEETWEEVTDAEDACLPPVEKVHGGETLRPVSLGHKAVETDDYCIEGIRTTNQYNLFLANRTRNLAEITSRVLTGRYVSEYRRLAGHHITALLAGPVDDDTDYDVSTPPDAPISVGLLDEIRSEMLTEAGDEPFMSDSANGAPVLPLLIGDQLSRQLIRSDPELRQDIRFAYEGEGANSPLVQAMNTLMAGRRAYAGWAHFILRYPPRWNISGGNLVRVEPFLPETAATKGVKRPINPLYNVAGYEEVIPYSEDVMKILEMQRITNAAPGWTFNAVDMTGTFRWVNEWHRDCNPDKNKGFFRAVFKNAAMPLHPELGYTILVQRCVNSYGAACDQPHS